MKTHGLHHTGARPTARLAAVGLGWGLAAGMLLVASPAGAGEAPEPMLRISVDNGRTSAQAGDTLDYTISVENIGADAVRDLRVTQTMPEGLTFESADARGKTQRGMVVWSVDVEPARTLKLHTTMDVGTTPDEVLRMATVACATMSAKKAPLVCATHSDELPTGRAARESVAADAQAAASDADSSSGLPAPASIGLVAAAVVMAGAALVFLRRRRAVA